MADTYTQLLVQFVFVVKCRENLVQEEYREELEKYMCGLVRTRKCKALAIYCNPDHCHLLIGLHPEVSIAELARDIKVLSTKWMNSKMNRSNRFSWQGGYAAFSYNRKQLSTVVKYILNQPRHHAKKTFREEYLEYLRDEEIEYNPKYVFDFYD